MGPGNPLGDHGQRAIALAVIFEPVLADEDGMGVSAPPPHQARAGLQHAAGVERASAFLELYRQNPKTALQCAAGAAMGALLQLIGEPPDDQIATEAQRRSGVIQRPPGAPQLLCRPIDQPGDFAINLGQVLVVRSVPSGVVCTETGERLARTLASRRIAGWRRHALAGSAMRYTRPRSSLAEARGSPSFFFKVPEKTPRTV